MQRHSPLVIPLVLIIAVFTSSPAHAQHDDAPFAPPAEAIDVELLEPAMETAARNAIASILARIQVNEGLVVPLVESSRRGAAVRSEELTVRYRKETRVVKRPIRKKVGERQVRHPITDEYGNITGYRTSTVPIYKVVGYKEEKVEMLVRDDKGPIVRTYTRQFYDREPIWHVPTGTLGVNGMGLYVLRHAGLTAEADQLAEQLRGVLIRTGLPDGTWDLAWLVAGFSGMDGLGAQKMHGRLVSKLIDGQIRDRGPAQGLWAPLCIHHQATAGYLALETKLYAELQRVERLIKQQRKPDPRLEKERKRVDDLLHAVRLSLDDTATQGNAYTAYDRIYQIRNDVFLSGLPYFFYTHQLADIDSTYLATWALAEAKSHHALPQRTARRSIMRQMPAPPEDTSKTLRQASETLIELMQEGGRWPEANRIVPNKAYNNIPDLQVGNIGPQQVPNPLLERETWRSNLRGHAALLSVSSAMGKSVDKADENIAAARGTSTVITNQLLSNDAFWIANGKRGRRFFNTRGVPSFHVYNGIQHSLEDLTRKEVRDELFKMPERTLDQLPAGYRCEPYSLLTSIATIYGPRESESKGQAEKADLFDRVAYQLLIEQGSDGQWRHSGFGAEIPSSVYAYQLQFYIEQSFARAKSRKERGLPPAGNINVSFPGTMLNLAESIGGMRRVEFAHTYATLAATAYLLERLEGPIDMTDATILTPELIERLNPIAEEIEEPAEEPDPQEGDAPEQKNEEKEEVPPPLTADEAARSVIRVNEHLDKLIDSVRSAVGRGS